MKKIWIIFKHEYTRHVLRKRFIVALLSVPLWILISVGAGVLSVLLQSDPTLVGYVDQSGLLSEINPAVVSESSLRIVEMRPYQNETQARAALEAKEIQAYFFVPAGYPEDPRTRLVYQEQPSNFIIGQFSDLLRAALLQDQEPSIAFRLQEGANLSIEALEDPRQSGGAGVDWFKIVAPIVAGIILIVSVFTSGGYLMQAVVEEKENRTMEILATSLSPQQIMSGKILALLSVGLTQVFIWSIFPMLILILVGPYLPFLFGVSINWRIIGLIAATTLPTFVMISALMATVGATVTEAREGQQVSTLITLPVMAPYMLISVIMTNPNGIISVALSIFPLTSAMTLLIRLAFATVPGWQIALSTIILISSAIGSLWLAGRVFRMGMLRYGKRMGWRDVLQAIASRRPVQPVEVRSHG